MTAGMSVSRTSTVSAIIASAMPRPSIFVVAMFGEGEGPRHDDHQQRRTDDDATGADHADGDALRVVVRAQPALVHAVSMNTA